MGRGIGVGLLLFAAVGLGGLAVAQVPLKMAPIISEIPSPIVGGMVHATGTEPFVFADALDLDKYVIDDATTTSQIRWSYAIGGTPKYAINGVDPLDLAQDDPTSPGLKQINNQVRRGESDIDGKPNTITIRNVNLSPFSGTGAMPGGTGIIDSQVVTLFASDGTSWSAASTIFYTDNGGNSRLSCPCLPPWSPPIRLSSWVWDGASISGVTSSANGGLCIKTPMTNGGIGSWSSPYGGMPTLIDNAVYRIRVWMNFTQAQAGARCPLWDLNIQNYQRSNDGVAYGQNLFGGDFYFFDNEGGANAISASDTNFEMWWCPTPIQTIQWKSGALTAANAQAVEGLYQFRVLDPDEASGISADKAGGMVCLRNMAVDRIDLSRLAPPANLAEVYHRSSFMKNVDADVSCFYGSTADFTSGTITLTPSTSGQAKEYMTVSPGDTVFDLNQGNSIPDNFPVTWEPNMLYMVTMDLSAPDANSENNPWDCLWISMDSPTNEAIAESYVTGAVNRSGMPKTGAPQTYTFFYYGGYGTKTAIPNGNRLRWRLSVGNNQELGFNPNTGGLRLHGVTVNKIKPLPQ